MLVVGKVGWGPAIHDTRLKPNEQITHITLWALQAAPLLIGADMSQFDTFTTDLMTNREVLEVDQDVMGRGASRVFQDERLEVWARPLADGTIAAGLFNRGLQAASVSVRFADLKVSPSQAVRDLWLQKDLGVFADRYTTAVPAHGAVLVKIGRRRG
jgi:alpha-galactosidase